MLQNTFIQEVVLLRSKIKSTLITCYLSCLLSIITSAITPRGINKLNLGLLGFFSSFVGLSISKVEDELNLKLQDLNIQSRVTAKEIYAGLLKDNSFEITLPTAPIQEQDIIADVVEYWKSQEKHLAIVAGTGSGKSHTIKYFINALQHEYSIATYDPDFCRDDYSQCVDIKYDYGAIEQALIDDMEELENRIAERRELGKNYIPPKKLIVGEEFPALSEECESLNIWIRKMSKRGRKVGLFIAALSQGDSAQNFALKGDYSILKSNFVMLYLGSRAKVRAKQLKNPALEEWLNGATKGRGLLDDRPCIIPSNIYQTANITTSMHKQDTIVKNAESGGRSEIEAVEVENLDAQIANFSEENKLIYARVLISEGYSKHRVIKLLWDITGGRKYQDLTRILNEVNE